MKKANMTVLASILMMVLVAAAAGAGTMAYFSDPETSTGNVFVAGTIDLVVDGEIPFEFYDVKPSEELPPFVVAFINVGQNPGHVSWVLEYVELDKPCDGDAGFEFSAVNDPDMEMTADEFAKLVYVKSVFFDRNGDGIIQPLGPNGDCVYTDYVETITDIAAQFEFVENLDWPPVNYATPWPGAPHGMDDEWVMPDWARWADINGDGYLSIYEVSLKGWNIDDEFGDTDSLDPGDVYLHVIELHLGDSLGDADEILTGIVDNKPQADGIDITVTVTMDQLP